MLSLRLPVPQSLFLKSQMNLQIKSNHLTLVKGNQFDGRTKIDAHKYIHEFLRICDMFKYRDTKNEVVRLMMFPLSLTGEEKTWLDELNEGTIETWDELQTTFISRFFPQLFSTDSLEKSELSLNMKMNLEITQKVLNVTAGDDIPMSHEEELKLMQTFRKAHFYNDYHDRDSNRNNWRSSRRNDYNRDNYRSNADDKPYDLQKQFNDFMKSQQSTNAFVKETFMDLKTQLKTIAKNHQALIQNLKTKFDRIADKQSGRPSGSLLKEPYFLPVIISSQLSKEKKNKLVSVLKKHKEAFAWKTTDIPGICPSFCKHKIQLLDDEKPVVKKQRRLNPNMQEVVKKETMKLLDTSIIYPIVDSPWVSPIHCVPKKGGITVVTNENDELVPIRTVMGWRRRRPRLELDKAKIDVISKLPPLQILKLLEKDTPFDFDDECQKAFELLKEKLTCAHVIILLLNEFDIEIKDRKGTKNVAGDHLSRIENDITSNDSKVDDNFPREALMEINTKDEPWFANFANYLVGDILPKGITYQQKNNFFSDLKHYFWEEPYLFKVCSDSMIRRCISGPETILDQCHHRPTGGHYRPNITAKKVLNSGFYWPTIIKEAHTLVRLYKVC
ncbi:reverse transcriptase domain-containing protein [Tanacetum coccineum]|uniref:Reverse transcriptase domain-containing protein n=1 Tax=Tanacetum coccineum TaxID=301880 RepID=A0ABQ4ZTE4_9ASTR